VSVTLAWAQAVRVTAVCPGGVNMPTESFIGVIKQRVGKYDANGKSSAYDLETILNVVNGDGTTKDRDGMYYSKDMMSHP
jgi:hypothetical protein